MLRFVLRLVAAMVLLTAVAGGIAYYEWVNQPLRENRFDPLIARYAREQGLDPFLVRALVWRESRFDPLTYGAAQEHGLMQITPDVGETWAKVNKITAFQLESLFDAETNLRCGTWYLNRSIRHWNRTDSPVTFGLAEYNAGRKNALKWVDPVEPLSHLAFLQRITFPKTRRYVETILAKQEEYRLALKDNRWYR